MTQATDPEPFTLDELIADKPPTTPKHLKGWAVDEWRARWIRERLDRTQQCSKCGQRLPLDPDHFGRDSYRVSGYRSECRPCRRIHHPTTT